MPADTRIEEPRQGGCRSFFVGGCLLAFGLGLLALLAVIAAATLLVRLIHLAWSYV